MIERMYEQMGISREVYDFSERIWDSLKGRFEEIVRFPNTTR